MTTLDQSPRAAGRANTAIPFLAIDLGTSNSKMAWFNPRTNQAEVLLNAEGSPATPSVVYYGDDQILVGAAAEAALENSPGLAPEARRAELSRFIASVKRRLGDDYRISLPDGRSVSPTDVAAEIFKKLKRDAEEQHFHEPLRRAVITCPSAFSPAQREALKQAAIAAGFEQEQVELLEEPVAAAWAYVSLGQKVGNSVLVYDLGGGTFDLAVLTRSSDGSFRLALETNGDVRCGGDDVDQALHDFWQEQIRQNGSGHAESGPALDVDVAFLRECRRRKENLSIQNPAASGEWQFQSLLASGQPIKLRIDRAAFDRLVEPLLTKTIGKTRTMLQQAEARGAKVDTVVLIGGSSRLPQVVAQLTAELPVAPRAFQQKDVAVALGAAFHGARVWQPPKPAPTVTVSLAGDGDYRSIAEAVANVKAGTRILIKPGIYRGQIKLQKSLELIADGAGGEVVIEGENESALVVSASSVEIRGLTITTSQSPSNQNRRRRGYSESGRETATSQRFASVEANGGHVVFADCRVPSGALPGSCVEVNKGHVIFDDCLIHCGTRVGFAFEGAAVNAVLLNCRVRDVISAISVRSAAVVVVDRCDIATTRFSAILVSQGADLTMRDTNIADVARFSAIVARDSSRLRVERCDISRVPTGLSVTHGAAALIRRVRIHGGSEQGLSVENGTAFLEDCEIVGSGNVGLQLKSKAVCWLARCSITQGQGDGLLLEPGATADIQECRSCDNVGSGAAIPQTAHASFRSCTLSGNRRFGLLHEGAGTIEECHLENNLRGAAFLPDTPIVRGLNSDSIYEPLRSTLRAKKWDRADIESQAILRATSGQEFLDTAEKAANAPTDVLQMLDQLWKASGSGPLKNRKWVKEIGYHELNGVRVPRGLSAQISSNNQQTFLERRLLALQL